MLHLAGNCVILKPSELAPQTEITVERLLSSYLDKVRNYHSSMEIYQQFIRECFHLSVVSITLMKVDKAFDRKDCLESH